MKYEVVSTRNDWFWPRLCENPSLKNKACMRVLSLEDRR